MITNARVLGDEYLPETIDHRDSEMNAFTDALNPITNGWTASTTYLVGPSGSGKTCLARLGLKHLREAMPSVTYQVVRCWEAYSRFAILATIAESMSSWALDRSRASTSDLIGHLRAHDRPLVVILDEADQLHDLEVLHTLYELPDVSLVIVANDDEDILARADQRVHSRVRAGSRVRLDRYGVEELTSILEERARLGLVEDAIERSEVATIADLAVGDAREAINILRCAAQIATREGTGRIDRAIVERGADAAQVDMRAKKVEELSPEPRRVYEVVCEHDEIGGSELQSAYRERADDPVAERTVRKYLSKLRQYDLVVREGSGRGTTYTMVDEPA